ncbi:hypothetical protein DFJ58DRAFT_651917 [Suillus subalutaceus]|uniref:uncharacterized protein n=1 Tax=Suillus subalutaceus TaxID=48586 RepID=UPI001B88110F|nr:uncharacterized protein DFJ58DRAFT_651917 [Suillus subalutaceus]KAG1872985.1 hypothetical protein DFJ58DRAFT_651917 [Suillus subalutaceus]
MFIGMADALFRPITTICLQGRTVKYIPWTAFKFTLADWERVNDTRTIITDANSIQQYFSSEQQPTLWCSIPAIEELQTTWEAKLTTSKYILYKDAIQKGLDKLGKYYQKFDDKPVYVLVLILHPYYKLTYIKMQWGGPEEQENEYAAGNPNTVDWHDEALKAVENIMEEYSKHSSPPAAITPIPSYMDSGAPTVESNYDHHRRTLVDQASREHNAGWHAELQCYLKDIPDDVSRDTDIIEWWSVSRLDAYCNFH